MSIGRSDRGSKMQKGITFYILDKGYGEGDQFSWEHWDTFADLVTAKRALRRTDLGRVLECRVVATRGIAAAVRASEEAEGVR
jgi:hypothetical protein